jgi:hypothetical protein
MTAVMAIEPVIVLASPQTASPTEQLIGFGVIAVATAALAIGVRLWKRKKLARPAAVQAAELAAKFDGRDEVRIYPTMTALPREQICEIAQQREYAFQVERTEGIRHPYQVMYFQRMASSPVGEK